MRRSMLPGTPCRQRARQATRGADRPCLGETRPRQRVARRASSSRGPVPRSTRSEAGALCRHTGCGFSSPSHLWTAPERDLRVRLGWDLFPPPALHRAARMDVPSTHHSSSGKPSSGATCSRRRESTLSKVPSPTHSLKKFHTVFHGPYSVGISRHGAPVLRIQNIASRSWRRSRGRRPVLKLLVGKRSRTRSHCSSLRPCRGTRALLMATLDHENPVRPRNRPFQGNGTQPNARGGWCRCGVLWTGAWVHPPPSRRRTTRPWRSPRDRGAWPAGCRRLR